MAWISSRSTKQDGEAADKKQNTTTPIASSGAMVSKSALIIVRVLQVLISLAFCITLGVALAGLAGITHWFNQPGRYDNWKLSPGEVNTVKRGLTGGMGGVGVLLFLCLLSFCLPMTWLCFTASSRARSRAHCCGNRTMCARYTCDITWDILLMIFWILMLAAVASGLAFYPRLLEFVERAKVEVVGRHVPRDSLPVPLRGVRLEDMTPEMRQTLFRLGETVGVVSANDVNTYHKFNRGAEIFLESGRIVLIVAVVLAAVQVLSFIISAALSGANRNALRGERDDVVLPMSHPPKPVVATGHMPVPAGVAAKPIVY